MKTRMLGTAILAVCAAMITYGASGCAADMAKSGTFTQTDLQGKWNVFLQTDNQLNYSYNYATVNIDESGVMTCEYYFDSDGNQSCDSIGAFPTVTMFPEGLVAIPDALIFGVMNADKMAVNLSMITEAGVWGIGIMSKSADDFRGVDLAGKWNVLLLGNGYNDYGFARLSVQVNELGQSTCLSIFSNNSGIENLSCDAIGTPSLSITSGGLIEIENTGIYGIMGIDRNDAILTQVAAEGVSGMGAMSKTTDDFTPADLMGEWIMTLFDNGNTGYGWSYIQMSVVNELGESACLAYFDSNGNDSCEFVSLPTMSITPDGLISTGGGSVYGIMSVDRSGGYLVNITAEGVTQTGVMTRR